jgi:hypothetical protein
MPSEKFAKLLSIVLGPHVWLPILFLMMIVKTGLAPNQIKIISPTILILQVAIPIAYLIIAPRLGWVSEWDMRKKEERLPFFVLYFFLTSITLFIISRFGNNLLLHLNIILIVLLTILAIITIFWKISLHASLNTISTIIINFLFNWQYPILYLTIPIICWSRFALKRHTAYQLIAGVTVTTLVTLGGLKTFGYL